MDLLEKNGIRSTVFRKEVIQVFLEKNHSVTPSQIEEALGDHDRITLYRTLKTFVEQGVIHEIVMPGTPKKFALCHDCQSDGNDHTHAHHHHEHVHFHCISCDEVICVETDIPRIVLSGYQVDGLEIQAKGRCPSCQGKS
jgi:Fur family ferric uptake transcriptional regulator